MDCKQQFLKFFLRHQLLSHATPSIQLVFFFSKFYLLLFYDIFFEKFPACMSGSNDRYNFANGPLATNVLQKVTKNTFLILLMNSREGDILKGWNDKIHAYTEMLNTKVLKTRV